MTSTIKVNNVQNQCGQNIINENSNTITIGASGDTIALASGASQTGFGREGSVDWQTGDIKTATFTPTSGEGYFCNTSGGAFTVNLPAGTAGAIVSLADYTRSFASNNLTVTPNGSEKIGGVNASLTLSIDGQALTLVYVDGTEGWINVQNAEDTEAGNIFMVATGGTITTCGNCKVHTFTGPGTFTVSQVHPCAANNLVSYVVVGGGGGGGSGDGGGGGAGAGGYRETKSPVTPYSASPLDGYPTPGNRITVTATAFPITVGAGGTGAGGAIPNPSAGTNGAVSTFSTITSAGGGAGGNFGGGLPASCGVGKNGASGGGGTSSSGGSGIVGGSGNTPPVTPPQGNNGGTGSGNTGGGGGGAGAVGETAPGPTQGGNGGDGAGTGINPSISVGTPGPTGPLRYFAGGGGGNNETPGGAPNQGTGGAGGGAAGDVPGSNGNAGTANTGGGGGGMDTNPSHPSADHNGGSGIVIIRYKFQ